jgi:hypothetical protein
MAFLPIQPERLTQSTKNFANQHGSTSRIEKDNEAAPQMRASWESKQKHSKVQHASVGSRQTPTHLEATGAYALGGIRLVFPIS